MNFAYVGFYLVIVLVVILPACDFLGQFILAWGERNESIEEHKRFCRGAVKCEHKSQ